MTSRLCSLLGTILCECGLHSKRCHSLPISRYELRSMSEEKMSSLLSALAPLPCAGAGCWTERLSQNKISYSCSSCDGSSSSSPQPASYSWTEQASDEEIKRFYDLLKTIMDSASGKSSRRLRVMVCQVIRRFINHNTNPKYLDLATGYFGRWCMKSFQSSIRELRTAST